MYSDNDRVSESSRRRDPILFTEKGLLIKEQGSGRTSIKPFGLSTRDQRENRGRDCHTYRKCHDRLQTDFNGSLAEYRLGARTRVKPDVPTARRS